VDAVKAYAVPIVAPRDLLEEYTKIRKLAVNEILKYVTYSKTGKAHLRFTKEDRRALRNELLKGWKFAKHYVDSAIHSAISIVKGWVTLYNKGKAKSKPVVTRRAVYVKTTLFSVKDGMLRITIEPRKRYLEVDLSGFDYLPKDYDTIGGLILLEDRLIITFKKNVDLREPRDFASFDVNLTNITALIGEEIVRFDLRELYHIHRVYEEKRKRIQKLSKTKPKTAKKLLHKYSRRERNRARDFIHKLTTAIARMLSTRGYGAILEDLKGIKNNLNKGKDLNRKLSKWNARTFQFMLEYKLRWYGLPVIYVNPAHTSTTCPLCAGHMVAYEGRLVKCKKCGLVADRDVVAAINLQMWGVRGAPERVRALAEKLLSAG